MELETIIQTSSGRIYTGSEVAVQVGEQVVVKNVEDVATGDVVLIDEPPQTIQDIQPVLNQERMYREASDIVYEKPGFTPSVAHALQETFPSEDSAARILQTVIGSSEQAIRAWYRGKTIAPIPPSRKKLAESLQHLRFVDTEEFSEAYRRVRTTHQLAGRYLQSDTNTENEGVASTGDYIGLLEVLRKHVGSSDFKAFTVTEDGEDEDIGSASERETVSMQDVSDAYQTLHAEVIGDLYSFVIKQTSDRMKVPAFSALYSVVPTPTSTFFQELDTKRLVSPLNHQERRKAYKTVAKHEEPIRNAIREAIQEGYVDKVLEKEEDTFVNCFFKLGLLANALPDTYHKAHTETFRGLLGKEGRNIPRIKLEREYDMKLRIHPLSVSPVADTERYEQIEPLDTREKWEAETIYWKGTVPVLLYEQAQEALKKWSINMKKCELYAQ